MHHFAYRDGILCAEAVSLDALSNAVGTPFYCYATATLARHYKVFVDAFADVDALICYAMKANSNQAVIATLARLGAGTDVVSGGELMRARLAGVPRDKIMFSGIGKTAEELSLATSTPRPTTRSPPARPRTNSVSRSAARVRSMQRRPACRASR
jgi:diaminopimelate decarboxylase